MHRGPALCVIGDECARDRLRENESQLQRFTIGEERRKKKTTTSKSNVKSFELCADRKGKKTNVDKYWSVVCRCGVCGDVSTGWDPCVRKCWINLNLYRCQRCICHPFAETRNFYSKTATPIWALVLFLFIQICSFVFLFDDLRQFT